MSSFFDPFILPSVAAVAGVAAGYSSYYVYARTNRGQRSRSLQVYKDQKMEGTHDSSSSLSNMLQASSLASSELELKKMEVKGLLLEKELASLALTRVFEAEADGRISRPERDLLATKYKQQIKGISDKLTKLDALVEASEVESLRTELVTMFNERITQLEARLEKARGQLLQVRGQRKETSASESNLSSNMSSEVKTEPGEANKKEVVSDLKVSKEEKHGQRNGEDVDAKLKEIHDEVLEALTKLEQIDAQE